MTRKTKNQTLKNGHLNKEFNIFSVIMLLRIDTLLDIKICPPVRSSVAMTTASLHAVPFCLHVFLPLPPPFPLPVTQLALLSGSLGGPLHSRPTQCTVFSDI